MPTLTWTGKDAVVNHHLDVPFRLLKDHPELSCGDSDSGNIVMEGDNLEGLKALLPYYAGRVDCVYIDPPYNTGNEAWEYNDNVNSPEIRDWLGKTVGKEAEDLNRHAKWLCMMYPRLKLLQKFLSAKGAIFVSIDDNEVSHLKIIMDEIFGAKNFISTIIWHKMDSPKNTAIHLSEDHEYILLYAKDAATWRPNKLPRTEAMVARYKNPDNDPRGPWLLSDLAARNFYADGRYPITTKTGRVIAGPPSGSYWRVSKAKFDKLEADNRIWWGKTGDNRPGIKRFLTEVRDGVVPQTLWNWKDVGSTRHSKQELSKIMAAGAASDLFVTPKPTALIERILHIATKKDSIVLDSFGGSGTTAHAVLKKNGFDGGNRKVITIEMLPKVAKEVTAKRIGKAINGYPDGKKEDIPGLGSGFRYVSLGQTLFDSTGQIRKTVSFGDLARHVWFSETGSPLPKEKVPNTPLLGVWKGTAIYLLYNGILGDETVNGGNMLTRQVLASLPKHDGPKVIYAAGKKVSDELLAKQEADFKQTPYKIRTQ